MEPSLSFRGPGSFHVESSGGYSRSRGLHPVAHKLHNLNQMFCALKLPPPPPKQKIYTRRTFWDSHRHFPPRRFHSSMDHPLALWVGHLAPLHCFLIRAGKVQMEPWPAQLVSNPDGRVGHVGHADVFLRKGGNLFVFPFIIPFFILFLVILFAADK